MVKTSILHFKSIPFLYDIRKQTCNGYLIKFSENQSAPKLENRKTSPCSPCAPNLLHVLVSRTLGYHNLCSPVLQFFVVLDYGAAKTRKVPTKITRSRRFQTLTQYPQNLSAKFSWRRVYANLVLPSWK